MYHVVSPYRCLQLAGGFGFGEGAEEPSEGVRNKKAGGFPRRATNR